MKRSPPIQGTCADRFEPVRRAFRANLRLRGEYGAGVCVWHRGQRVVDLWSGLADIHERRPWHADTMTTVFSCTKGMVALCFLMLADRGELDYDAPVATYWPAFAQSDNASITVRTLLNHRAGLIGVDRALTLDTLEQPERMAEILAAQRPAWPPGTSQGYHGVTYGLYAQALFRMITNETLGRFFAREVARPLHADVYLGLPDALQGERVATTYQTTTTERLLRVLPKLLLHRGVDGRVYRQVALGGAAAKAFAEPSALGTTGIGNFNTRRVRAMELPWANAIASARGLCRVYAALANGGTLEGVRLVGADALAPLRGRQSFSHRDRVLQKPIGWSQGFVKEETRLFSPNAASFGHPGAGGALGWCDPDAQLAIAYVPNKMDHRVRSRRALALSRAVYRCLG